MKQKLFTGAATALITPFSKDGSIDFNGLSQLIEHQIENGISALVIAGTTGEASTLTFEEFSILIAKSNEIIRKRVPLIAGTGTNNTTRTLKLSHEAEKQGADGLLIVTPYYNKTTPSGLIHHYWTVADQVNTPILLYNVPGRTGMNIDAKTCKILTEHPKIIGIKEASGNIDNMLGIVEHCNGISLYSGNDDSIIPALALGGDGVISVASNVVPKEIQSICTHFQKGEKEEALKIQLRLMPLIRALFAEVNPIPVKYAVHLMGFPAGEPRLPLVPCSHMTEKRLLAAIKELGI